MTSHESALVALVPAAEDIVKPFRDRFDPTAAAGVPAHITLLYPFKAPGDIDDVVTDRLRDCFSRSAPIRFSFGEVKRFPGGVLYLAPKPAEPFRQLTLSVWKLYPEWPPYGGKWPEITPHLSIASVGEDALLTAIESEFAEASRGRLPITSVVSDVSLMMSHAGRWTKKMSFPMGSSNHGTQPLV